MLKENTGIHMLDSGMGNGRQWQRNASKTLADFKNAPEVDFEVPEDAETSKEIEFTISVFHYLTRLAELEKDATCEKFNRINVGAEDWDGEYYGVCAKAQAFLDRKGFKEVGTFNTYNGESALSQILQGTYIREEGSVDTYILLQVHGGADARGGYTDARMFLLADSYLPNEDIEGTVNEIGVSTSYSDYGTCLVSMGGEGEPETGEPVPLKGDGKDDIVLALTSY